MVGICNRKNMVQAVKEAGFAWIQHRIKEFL